MKKKIISYLSKTGSVSVIDNNLRITNTEAIGVLSKCNLSKKEIAELVPQNTNLFVIHDCETKILFKPHPNTNIFEVGKIVTEIGKSDYINSKITINCKKRNIILTLDLHAKLYASLGPETTVFQTILKANLYDSKLSFIQKINSVFERITIIFQTQ
jgi:hypothetical protein